MARDLCVGARPPVQVVARWVRSLHLIPGRFTTTVLEGTRSRSMEDPKKRLSAAKPLPPALLSSSSSEDEEPGYKTFSQINSLGHLWEVFWSVVRVRGTATLGLEHSGSLSRLLADMQPADLTAVKEVYGALFDRGDGLEKVKLPANLPDFLKPLFRHMAFCRNRRPPEPLFHNGAGKTWGMCLLEMRHHVGTGAEWGVKISTTSNTSDWCGMRASNIAGNTLHCIPYLLSPGGYGP